MKKICFFFSFLFLSLQEFNEKKGTSILNNTTENKTKELNAVQELRFMGTTLRACNLQVKWCFPKTNISHEQLHVHGICALSEWKKNENRIQMSYLMLRFLTAFIFRNAKFILNWNCAEFQKQTMYGSR